MRLTANGASTSKVLVKAEEAEPVNAIETPLFMI